MIFNTGIFCALIVVILKKDFPIWYSSLFDSFPPQTQHKDPWHSAPKVPFLPSREVERPVWCLEGRDRNCWSVEGLPWGGLIQQFLRRCGCYWGGQQRGWQYQPHCGDARLARWTTYQYRQKAKPDTSANRRFQIYKQVPRSQNKKLKDVLFINISHVTNPLICEIPEKLQNTSNPQILKFITLRSEAAAVLAREPKVELVLTVAGKLWLLNPTDGDIDLPHGDLFGFSLGTWQEMPGGGAKQN